MTEGPFEFAVERLEGMQLYETYHGVFVNVQYAATVEVARSLLAKNLQKTLEFIVELPVCCSFFTVLLRAWRLTYCRESLRA